MNLTSPPVEAPMAIASLMRTYRLIPIRTVLERTSLSRTTLYQLIKEGTFPPPVKVGTASRWVEAEVEEWVQSLMQARG